MPFWLIQIPIFPNYIKELPTSFPLPGSGRYSVVLPAQERDVVNPSAQGNGVLGSQNSKGSPVSPAHSRLQGTQFGWHCQAELKQFLLTLWVNSDLSTLFGGFEKKKEAWKMIHHRQKDRSLQIFTSLVQNLYLLRAYVWVFLHVCMCT